MPPLHFLIRRPAHAAFTLIELLVVISIIAVLAAVSLPIFSSVQENGRSSQCVSNLRQIGAATDLYVNDHNNCLPPLKDPTTAVAWDNDALAPYLPQRVGDGGPARQSVLFICPDAKYKGDATSDLSRTYTSTECMLGPGGSSTVGSNRTTFAGMTGTLMLYDAAQDGTNRYSTDVVTWAQVSGANDLHDSTSACKYIDYRHRNAFHGLFADGHVETIFRKTAKATVTELMWTGRVAK